MKTKLSRLPGWLQLAVFALLPAVAQAQFTFTTNNGALTLTAYTGSGGSVVIPAMTNGLPVASIGPYAFESSGLTNVFIGGEVTSIGQQAFYLCYGLRKVYFYGDAPTLAQSVYLSDGNLTNYYRANTTGWGASYGGFPTAPWQPSMPAAGITTYSNHPVVILPYLANTIGSNFVVQMSTSLASTNWVTVTNGVRFVGLQVTNASGTVFFRLQ